RGRDGPPELVEVVHDPAVEDGQVGHRAGGDLQFGQWHRGRYPEVLVVRGAGAGVTHACAQPEATASVLHPAKLHELTQDPGRGGAGQTGDLDDVLEEQMFGSVLERVDDERDSLHHARPGAARRRGGEIATMGGRQGHDASIILPNACSRHLWWLPG